MSIHDRGLEGERIACQHLRGLGVRVLHTRFRAQGGEIDIIAQEGDCLCFVEVKYRPQGRIGDGIESVDWDKRRRLRLAASHYLATHAHPRLWRYDALEITRAGVWYLRGGAQAERG